MLSISFHSGWKGWKILCLKKIKIVTPFIPTRKNFWVILAHFSKYWLGIKDLAGMEFGLEN